MRQLAVAFLATSLVTVAACSSPPAEPSDTGPTTDARVDGSAHDAATDGGHDAAIDTGVSPDVSMPDSGLDAGMDLDAGGDAGIDAAADDAGTDASVANDVGTDATTGDAGCSAATDCNDGDACTTDTCTTGTCSHAPLSSIDDGSACTTDACNSSTGSITHTPLSSIDDANPCTADACDASTGAITHSPIAAIDDGDACTTDACNSSSGAITHTPLASINDGDVCTTDACNSSSGSISHTPIANCCTSGATCASGVCQTNMCVPAQCNDGVRNGTETAIDCGGASCGPCTLGQACMANSDCDTHACSGSICVECNAATDCPGSDTDCHMRTCSAHVCGVTNVSAGVPTSSQISGNCRENRCDGSGNIVSAIDDADLPADDGSQCTSEVCSAGVPAHPALASGTACSQSGGTVCDGSGNCVQCVSASSCPGSDTDCQTRTCTANTCGFNFQPTGTLTSSQTSGDCHENECNGIGGVSSIVDDVDVPVDGNQCTNDTCVAGVPSNAATASGVACSQSGGVECDGAGSCVQCLAATDCPGVDNACETRTCTGGACGLSFQPSGTTVASPVGDCHRSECDGAGMISTLVDDTDIPVDGNQCTNDVCSAGAASNPASMLGTACSQSGGVECNGAGLCLNPPTVVSTTPADGVSVTAGTSIQVTFSTAMNPATLTAQTSAGPCTGSVQVSLDNFATCIAFSSTAPVMSGSNTIATLTAAPGELINRSYAIRVTTAAQSSGSLPLTSTYTQALGFTTVGAGICGASTVVIAQVYGAGGNSGALYNKDFVVLHNRGTTAVTMTNWSIQYAATTGASWTVTTINGIIPAGGYFLVAEAGGATGSALPAPDVTGTISMAGGAGKVALVSNNTALTGSCPTGLVDFVGYGAGTDCFEGTGPTGTLSAALAAVRAQSACTDSNSNAADFATGAPNPLNSATANVSGCGCVWNESAAANEADYCDVQFPLSLSVMTGTSSGNVYGQIYELGLTEAAGAPVGVRAQFGYGAASVNPEYQSGWTWSDATYNTQVGNNDEYQASITAPAVGTYRYAYRFSLDNGASWTYCDANSGDSGAGSNAGLAFDLTSLPILTVTP